MTIGRAKFCAAAIATGLILGALSVAGAATAAPPPADEDNALILAPTSADWTALSKLPDWSGIWSPDVPDQARKVKSDVPPWTPKAAKRAAEMAAEEVAGHPEGPFVPCLPEATPAWMLISHNPMEILFTPGRVTILGESDSTRLRRIYTDGRPHPVDPDLTFHGHSIGHWDGDTLVVDTVGVLPQAYVAVSEAVAIPNDGDMHVVERLHLTGANTLADELEITAPKILTRPWKTTRFWYRERERKFDIVEGVCAQGDYVDGVDKAGDAIFVPVPHKDGNRVLTK